MNVSFQVLFILSLQIWSLESWCSLPITNLVFNRSGLILITLIVFFVFIKITSIIFHDFDVLRGRSEVPVLIWKPVLDNNILHI